MSKEEKIYSSAIDCCDCHINKAIFAFIFEILKCERWTQRCGKIKNIQWTIIHKKSLPPNKHLHICCSHTYARAHTHTLAHAKQRGNCSAIQCGFEKGIQIFLSYKNRLFLQFCFSSFVIYAETNVSFYVHFPCNAITMAEEGNRRTYSTSDSFWDDAFDSWIRSYTRLYNDGQILVHAQ